VERTIQIVLNGKSRDVRMGATLEDLVALLELRPEQVAVEVNRRLVSRDARRGTVLSGGDEVEFVTLVGGG
jgi:sulfur carrier protein